MRKPFDLTAPVVMKGAIKHRFATPEFPALARVARVCVTDPIVADPSTTSIKSTLSATLALQFAIRGHYFQATKFNPSKVRKYAYALNCPPSTFHVTPYTNLCKNSRVCPWCFSRRMFKVFCVLTKPPLKIRKSSKLLLWRRDCRVTDGLPFLPSTRGPHQWCDASVTVQLMLPIFNPHIQSFHLRHIGIQVVPKTTTNSHINRKVNRKNGQQPLVVGTLPSCTHADILKAFKASVQIPWMTLYEPENFPHFIDLLGMFPRQQLLRISRYKP